MKKFVLSIFCLIFFSVFVLFCSSQANAWDFDVSPGTSLPPGWSYEHRIIPFVTAAIAFDSEDNLYSNNIVVGWHTGIATILRLEAPSYAVWEDFVSFPLVYETVTGLDFDDKGNLFVSEVIRPDNPNDFDNPDSGLIRKIAAHSLKVSDPIIFVDIPNVPPGTVGDFRPTGLAAIGKETLYFPGRKWSLPDWGNIYKIESFKKYDPNTEPTIFREGLVLTGLADDCWGKLFSSSPSPDNSVYTRDFEGNLVKIAKFNKPVEELTFSSKGNLYVLEGEPIGGDTEVIKLIPPHIKIDGCDTGIIDWPFRNKPSISEEIENCAVAASSHGEFVSCVVHYVDQLKRDGFISNDQKVAIVRCAAQADIP